MAGMTVIVRTIARLLFPFTFLFGAYVVAHGHLTPGGGFPGGVIIAASVVMLILAYGMDWIQGRVGFKHAEVMESAGLVAIFVIGLLGFLLGSFFLQNVLPMGRLGQLFSGGDLPLLYLAVGIEVAAGIFLIFYAMLFKSRGEEE
jgi:multicomponent Na+:H+ antiporter subunit B